MNMTIIWDEWLTNLFSFSNWSNFLLISAFNESTLYHRYYDIWQWHECGQPLTLTSTLKQRHWNNHEISHDMTWHDMHTNYFLSSSCACVNGNNAERAVNVGIEWLSVISVKARYAYTTSHHMTYDTWHMTR